MVKYTHLIERCSSFLRTGVAWKLKEHGYTFSEAYWRLRDGKGLQSAYDKESLKIWSDLITCVRRNTAAAKRLRPKDQELLKEKRTNILKQMEAYRDHLEIGSKPQYLYDGTSPIIVEHILTYIIRDVRELDVENQLEIWQNLDVERLKKDALICMKEVEEYTMRFAETKNMDEMLTPEEWTKRSFDKTFVKDKVWQIRTDHDTRSSVNAGINEKLNFIWNIPSKTNENHRAIYRKNMILLDVYQNWKDVSGKIEISYENILTRVHEVLDSIKIPEFK